MFSIKRQIGNQAEDVALEYLTQQGLTLVQQNYLTKVGEIDLIMLDVQTQVLVFVEVRYRRNAHFGSAVESVNRVKQLKIIRTAQHYLQKQHEFDEYICRFDVIGLESDLKYPTINWIKDAFEG
jgi:putative endonuclease